MTHKIKVYISENNQECEQLVTYLNEKNIAFQIKNVTANKDELHELQKMNIYLTPAIIINEKDQIIGFHKESIDKYLQLMPKK
ncbi:glutaredoxin family protein [Gracilibacillus massiliensis]|uniref:glutaredoxin family protein n=1 Tax=Gracilibacillus massiliensis TaxID=1564956 RepID=UPI00071D794B|nr:glutaredoxin family protein [Gracilibacillus massiliensis]